MQTAAKTVIITGGNTGLGFETAKVIASASTEWHVIIASRSQQKGNEAAQALIHDTRNPHISAMVLDLSSFSSIKQFADQFTKADHPPLHAIVCNAGAAFVQGTQVTADGLEATFGVNHMGHFLLVRLLYHQLMEPGRIVVVSSDTHQSRGNSAMSVRYASPGTMADPVASDQYLHDLNDFSKGMVRYATSKLTNLYFTYELSRRVQQSKPSISVVAFNPGAMPGKGSALARDYKPFMQFIWNHVMPLFRFVSSAIRTTKQSGNDLAQLVLKNSLQSGTYWDGPKEIASSEESYDLSRALELWDWSSERVELNKEL
ncbi:SDR family NAD(P)-dependent oxidoreductase [Paenibacillus sp. GCM10012306]|uniref:SDR family NAD(P)-dependent oxidoreductase n=1 Tax=Paenibacillus sp. GCM10012306 TaxID=3317342 RepID=UPI00361CADC6